MPWKEETVEKNRTEFVARAIQKEESISSLCREYGISRKTGYKWLERGKNGEGLENRSQRPLTTPNRTIPEMEEVILSARDKHPAWGARKLKRYLEDNGCIGLPAQSTICEILKRNDRVTVEASKAAMPYLRFERKHPNALWQMDFKGDFGMLDGERCHPLTIIDDHSRFCLCLKAQVTQQAKEFTPVFEKLLWEFGVPQAILCDNGNPWGDSHGGITLFDVWMMQIGVTPIHGRIKHPQTQGKDERFNRTLKDELIVRTVFKNQADAQEKFNPWREEYNHERPHAALGLDTPSKHYTASNQPYDGKRKEPDYDIGINTRKVNTYGFVFVRSHRYFLSESLAGKRIALNALDEKVISLRYGSFEVASIDLQQQCLLTRKVRRPPL